MGAGTQGPALTIEGSPSVGRWLCLGMAVSLFQVCDQRLRSRWKSPSPSLQVWTFTGISVCASATGHGPFSPTEHEPWLWGWLSLAWPCSPGRPRPNLAATVLLGALS